MAENTVMNLKVFLRNDKEAEARRFSVDMSAVTSFVFIKEKLQTVFPTLRQSPFKLTWKDKEGDEITIASDEDLITAFTEMSELPVKVLYIQAGQNQPDNIFIEADLEFPMRSHPLSGGRIVCDACNSVITGLRYKCLQCPDYDLCASCEFQGNHSEHIMMRLPSSDSNLPRCARKFMHHLGREIKKSAHYANKEAFRAAKCARKFCGQSTSQPKPADHPPCGSTPQGQGQSQSGCPFTSQEYPGMNLNDLLGLGDMAKQHLPTLVDFLQNVAGTPAPNNNNNNNAANTKEGENNSTTNNNTNANTESTPNVNEQMGLLSDAFRNIIGNFLVPFPKDNPEEQKTDSAEKPTETKTAETVAMDVDTNVIGQTEQLPRRDPGWTFVAANPTPVSEPNPQQAAEPTAPTLVYHDNPKIAEGLVKLHEMGFSNDGGFLTHMLERHNGNVAAVVRALLDSTT